MSILNLIAQSNYIVVNKDLIRNFGVTGAIIIGELASEYSYWEINGLLSDDGFFYSTADNIEKNTGIKESKQRTAIKALVELGVLESKVKGLPAKRHFKINEDVLMEFLTNKFCENEGTGCSNLAEQEPPKSRTNNNNINNNKNKNNREKEILKEKDDDSFLIFWKAYPKKVGKADAQKKFKKVDVDLNVLLDALNKQKHSEQWKRDNGQYIPNPSTWLNQRRWEDELDVNIQTESRNERYERSGERAREEGYSF